jgi:hypothetical protein
MSGLSKLQRRILTVLATFRVTTTADLLERVYGWTPRADDGFRYRRRPDGGLEYGGQWFQAKQLAHEHATRVALSRAIHRLEDRGLVVRVGGVGVATRGGYGRGFALTAAGAEAVERLTESAPRTSSTISHEPAPGGNG